MGGPSILLLLMKMDQGGYNLTKYNYGNVARDIRRAGLSSGTRNGIRPTTPLSSGLVLIQ